MRVIAFSIVLAGLAIGLGIYLGLKAVGMEIKHFGPVDATITLECHPPAPRANSVGGSRCRRF